MIVAMINVPAHAVSRLLSNTEIAQTGGVG
jgi:hypothetical protein